MSMVRIEKGKHLIHKDDAQEKLEIILQGACKYDRRG